MHLGTTLAILFLAVLLDLLIGDPGGARHPVALTGRLIAAWERLLYPESEGAGASPTGAGTPPSGTNAPSCRAGTPPCGTSAPYYRAGARWRGALLVLGTVLPVWLLAYACLAGLRRLQDAGGHPFLWSCLYAGAGALLLCSTISIRSLGRAGREILLLLRRGELAGARRQVGYIVGRDTGRLEEAEIVRATVETVAENISDGVIAPLCYFLVGGVPLACAYRAVNTLDSMLGYRSERYRDFGTAAARLDDVANFLPARLTMLLLVGSALLLGYDWRQAWRIARRDARRHPSPNSGYPEAAVAGALGVQLGGLNYYRGVPSRRACLGDPGAALEPAHIAAAIRLLYGAAALFLVLTAAGWLLWMVLGPGT